MTDALAVDTSAIVAILTEEPEALAFRALLDQSPLSLCSSITFLETFMVLSSRISDLRLDDFRGALQALAIAPAAVEIDQAIIAAEAFRRFGKGRHPARLNLGDCFSYALAKSLNAPLLFKGDDCGRTDILAAITTETP